MFWVYVVYNRNAAKFYIGQTENLPVRIRAHNYRKFMGYTARFPGKWELIYKESVATRSEAIKREKQLKSFRGRESVKKFIPG